MGVALQIANRHFGKAVVTKLARKGVKIYGLQRIAVEGAPETGYLVNVNGCGRVLAFNEVAALAA